MAGFFGFFDYTKPGPGVPDPEDAPKKARFIVFFEIFSRKFWNLIRINMMFCIFNIPAIILAFIATHFIFPGSMADIKMEGVETEFLMQIEILLRFMFASVLICIPVITTGPAQAGFTYLLRNYAREEHAFIWGDFREHAGKNMKQSLVSSLIGLLAIVIMGISYNFYKQQGGTLSFMAGWFMIVSLVIFMIMHMYIYPMMVTFKLSLKQLYKNAFLFAIMKLLPNIGILLLCIALIFAPYIICFVAGLNPMIAVFLFPFLTVSLIGFLTNFYVYPKLQKYIIDKIEGEGQDESEENEEGEQTE